ncbi:MAG: hypothetical protein Q8M08_01030 [Bacteroidales bacterium]|nr:hypothetical protein [Bacteroidales bacterium]
MKKKITLFLSLVVLMWSSTKMTNAQVSINNDGTGADASAMLEVKSSTKGVLFPRLTTVQRNTLGVTAVAGLVVYDTDLKKLFIHDGIIWQENGVGNYWLKSGTKVYLSPVTDYIGIGTANPDKPLEVRGTWQTVRFSSSELGAGLELVGSATTNWSINTWSNNLYLLSSDNLFTTKTDQYKITANDFSPFTNNTKTLGGSSTRWSNLYSVAGDFSGAITGTDINLTGTLTGANISYWGTLAGFNASFSGALTGINASLSGTLTGNNARFTGSVGIGTTAPISKLHVHDAASHNAKVYITPMAPSIEDSSTLFLSEGLSGQYGMYWLYDGVGNEMELWGKASGTNYGPHMQVSRNSGNVAFGNTFAAGYKLSVSGKIICTELRVNQVADWPDYVFKKGYDLMPVARLGSFIEEHGHLPNIPPAAEIAKSGLEVGEMQRRMMEKIEELTLYMIEHQKQINDLKEKLQNSTR